MRAYQLPKAGAGIEALTMVERPMPKPAYRQVLVKVAACSLNFRDLGIVRGTYRMSVQDHIIPLSDGAGEVVEVGAGVTRVKVGDKVAGCFFQRWSGGEPPPNVQANALGGSIDGMLAEFVVLEEEGVVKVPAHLSVEEGATLPCAGVTAWHALVEHGKLIAGQTILLQGTAIMHQGIVVPLDGSLGPRNDARAHSIEHKLGIHASPTCTMVYGDHGGATGFLVGEENRGMACMFTMMNQARLSVALQGVAIAERYFVDETGECRFLRPFFVRSQRVDHLFHRGPARQLIVWLFINARQFRSIIDPLEQPRGHRDQRTVLGKLAMFLSDFA